MILFNHIPKTGGTTLRIILNRVYGIEKVFFIESRDIKSSIDKFSSLTKKEQNKFKIIAGHGASMFSEFVENPYTITILREPIELFISQYRFLKISPNSLYFDEVSKIERIEDYLEFALKTGQDNLLTRYLSDSMQFLTNPDVTIPDMNVQGDQLLQKATDSLKNYNAILNLSHFDKGVYALKEKLKWKSVPIYRPSNTNKKNNKQAEIDPDFLERLKHALRFDIALFENFVRNKIDVAEQVDKKSMKYNLFLGRQFMLNSVARLLGKS